jgi:hypothetical protein
MSRRRAALIVMDENWRKGYPDAAVEEMYPPSKRKRNRAPWVFLIFSAIIFTFFLGILIGLLFL